jgi:pimeloyl-ACP methyl ester carboxylesterase
MPTIPVGDINIYYEMLGQGEPLLLIMGLNANLLSWGPTLPARLAERYQVILFDNRGAGRTDQPDGPYTMEQMADDATGLLDALDIPSAHVFGGSMGGMIAQHVALNHADKVRKLILGCTMCGGSHAVSATPEVLAYLMPDPTLNAYEAAWRGVPICYTPEFIDANKPLIEETLLAACEYPTRPAAYEAQLGAVMASHDTYDRLPQIAAPTLVLTGNHDVLIPPENSRILAERIPNAQLHEIDGAGHVFSISHPDASLAAITDFLG